MTLTELQELVVSQTKRPDVPAITTAAIRSAILRAHHVDVFPRDLAFATILYEIVAGAIYYDIQNLSSILPRLRTLKFVEGQDSASRSVELLEYRDADDAYEVSTGRQRQSFYTLLGDTLRVYPALVTGKLVAYYYQNPAIQGDVVQSWIADTYPQEIAMWAAGIVFARTGYTEQAQLQQALHVQPFKELLVAYHLLGNA